MEPLHHLKKAADIIVASELEDEFARLMGDDPRDTIRWRLEQAREHILAAGVPFGHLSYHDLQTFLTIRDTFAKPLENMIEADLELLANQITRLAAGLRK